jgi:hypothetical protein
VYHVITWPHDLFHWQFCLSLCSGVELDPALLKGEYRTFVPIKYEVTGGWRKLCNENLHSL